MMRAWAKTNRARSVSLHTAYPTLANELSGSGYSRVTIGGVYTWDLPVDWNNVSSYIENNMFRVQNVYPFVFPEASANWSPATHVGIWGDVRDLPGGTSSSLLMTATLDSPLSVENNHVGIIEKVSLYFEVR